MPFKEKDWVKIISLKRRGQVSRVLRSGGYEVLVGEFTIQCQEKNLILSPHPDRDSGDDFGDLPSASSKSPSKKGKSKGQRGNLKVTPSIDLHGMRVDEALKYTEDRINAAILSHADGLRIVHGKGSGKVKAALHQYLKKLGTVKRFRIDEKNEGVTWVYF